MILQRFLIRELSHSILGIMLILLFFVLSNMLIRTLDVAAAESIVNPLVLNIIGTMLPKYIGMLLPVALLISILVVYGKLLADNELLVCFASGMSWRKLAKITCIPATVIFVIVLMLSLWVMPLMSVHQMRLSKQVEHTNDFSLVKPGRFVSAGGGNQVIYIGNSSPESQEVSELFIFEQKNEAAPLQIITAPQGYQEITPEGERFYYLSKGHVYRFHNEQPDVQVIAFDQYGLKVQKNQVEIHPTLDGIPTSELWASDRKDYIAELQWRLVLPLSAYVLSLIALSVCNAKPRQGRYSKIFPGVLIFIVYFNLLSLSRSWVEKGFLPSMIGLWWVPFVFGGVAILRLAKMEGVIQLPWKRTSA